MLNNTSIQMKQIGIHFFLYFICDKEDDTQKHKHTPTPTHNQWMTNIKWMVGLNEREYEILFFFFFRNKNHVDNNNDCSEKNKTAQAE